MTPQLAADLRSWLIEPDHAAEQRDPLPLDANQRTLVNTRTSSGYRRIKGAAGSGKSAVLAARAARLASEGEDVLVVSYNLTLLHYLRDLCARAPSGRPNDITWLNFHALCKRLAVEMDLEGRYNSLWKEHFDDGTDAFRTIPNMLLERLTGAPPSTMHYSAILVDEGQDLDPSWWQLLRRLCRPNGEMMLVADATQDLYGTSKFWTEQAMLGAGFSGQWSEMQGSYRLPQSVLELAAQFAEHFLPSEARLIPRPQQGELAVEPCHLRWLQVEPDKAVDTCVGELFRLVKDNGSQRSMTDLTLLVDSIDDGVQVARELNLMNIKTSETFAIADDAQRAKRREDRRKKLAFWKGQPRVKLTTLHSFKGWEARLIVLQITHALGPRDLAAIYTGLTRVKRHPEGSAITVVCGEPRLREFGKLWPDFVDRTGAATVPD